VLELAVAGTAIQPPLQPGVVRIDVVDFLERLQAESLQAVMNAAQRERVGVCAWCARGVPRRPDGSKLSFVGLPTPNIFAGEHNFHSRLEWVSAQDMEKAVEVIVNLAAIWEERS
jgi:tripeptide aminopeptidase